MRDRDLDRKKMSEIMIQQDRINKELFNLKYFTGLSDKKPVMFVKLENEIADIKQNIMLNKTDL